MSEDSEKNIRAIELRNLQLEEFVDTILGRQNAGDIDIPLWVYQSAERVKKRATQSPLLVEAVSLLEDARSRVVFASECAEEDVLKEDVDILNKIDAFLLSVNNKMNHGG